MGVSCLSLHDYYILVQAQPVQEWRYSRLYVYRLIPESLWGTQSHTLQGRVYEPPDAAVRPNSFNPLASNDIYTCRTAQLTSRRCILNIYSTNILTEYFKHTAHSPFFFSSRCRLFHNAIFFGSCNIHILYTECAKILKKIPAPKGYLTDLCSWRLLETEEEL